MTRTLILHPYIFIQIVTSLLGAMSFFLEGFNDAIGLQLCVCVCVCVCARARAGIRVSIYVWSQTQCYYIWSQHRTATASLNSHAHTCSARDDGAANQHRLQARACRSVLHTTESMCWCVLKRMCLWLLCCIIRLFLRVILCALSQPYIILFCR